MIKAAFSPAFPDKGNRLVMRVHESTDESSSDKGRELVEIRVPAFIVWLLSLFVFHATVLSFFSLFVCLLVWQTGNR
jgi:hypothetical protein